MRPLQKKVTDSKSFCYLISFVRMSAIAFLCRNNDNAVSPSQLYIWI